MSNDLLLRLESLLPCGGCGAFFYCSEVCRDTDSLSFHAGSECLFYSGSRVTSVARLTDEARLTVRLFSLLKEDPGCGDRDVQLHEGSSITLNDLLSLLPVNRHPPPPHEAGSKASKSPSKPSPSKPQLHSEFSVGLTIPVGWHDQLRDEKDFDLFSKLLLLIKVCAIPIRCPETSVLEPLSAGEGTGLALYLESAGFASSCAANAVPLFASFKMQVRALGDIEAGAVVCLPVPGILDPRIETLSAAVGRSPHALPVCPSCGVDGRQALATTRAIVRSYERLCVESLGRSKTKDAGPQAGVRERQVQLANTLVGQVVPAVRSALGSSHPLLLAHLTLRIEGMLRIGIEGWQELLTLLLLLRETVREARTILPHEEQLVLPIQRLISAIAAVHVNRVASFSLGRAIWSCIQRILKQMDEEATLWLQESEKIFDKMYK